MSDELKNEIVQSSTMKPVKKAKNKVLLSEKTRIRGSRLPGEIVEDSNSGFADAFIMALKALPKVRREHKPKFDSVYKRKLMALFWCEGDQKRQGFFTPTSLTEYYALRDNTWSDKYFTRLIREGWITAIDTHLPTHRRAILSPLFFGLIQAITNTLRRDYPERFPKIASAQAQAIPSDTPAADIVENIPDLR